MERFKNPKLVAALVVAALALVVFLQNRAPVGLKVLWLAEVQTSVSTALLGSFASGVVAGALAFSRWKSQREKSKSASAPAP
ncbi:MAG: LapA family protein [Planctomycetes bacterium]|nr:LapA family protein [Planctomycetota bacterium]